ncbi:MAG: FdtA/QdtA family cupin domain-containing protein [Bacteroidia bacterium]|nr:FdtA/QdtA family cupin domain-containing protein [Bacteroidia bacterium]MDW8347766.1 FdtA/QdtA family cupin domain-containing protein [Bacteroidia bacterium]
MVHKQPTLLDFGAIGDAQIGYISVAEFTKNLPFEVKRIFWTYFTPNNVIRGRHAHKELEQILIAVAGTIWVTTENIHGEKQHFTLDEPRKGLYIPTYHWNNLQFSHNAVLLSLTSQPYNAEEYIRDYDEFRSYGKIK